MVKAIITGDVVHSTKMTVENRTWVFNQIAGALKVWNRDFDMKSETFRGDSFQCLLNNPAYALTMALLQKTFIRGLNTDDMFEGKMNALSATADIKHPTWIFDARIAIGIGEVDVLAGKLASSGGIAFSLSGHLLDKIKSKKQSLAMASNDSFNDELETESILLDAIISRTSALQCQVINLKLLGYTETEIAKKLGIMQSAVNQRSISGNWNAIEAMIRRFEKIYRQ